MTSENKLALLNLAARHLGPDETYLEIGAWVGCSILGAALGNAGRFVTVDDFSEFGGRDDFQRNLEAAGRTDITLVEGDSWAVLADPPFPGPVGVYFYDGGHTFAEQYRAFSRIEPMLADQALIVVDDTAWARVAAANRRYVRNRPEYERVFRFESERNGDPRWWNGIEVYAFRRADGRPRSERALRARERRHLRRRRAAMRVRRIGRTVLGPVRSRRRPR